MDEEKYKIFPVFLLKFKIINNSSVHIFLVGWGKMFNILCGFKLKLKEIKYYLNV